jgi:hypothetical protein
VPYLINLRVHPFERQGWPNNGTKEGAQQYFDWFKFQFWRFVFVQQVVAKELQTFLDYPPMQRRASFNLDAVRFQGRGQWFLPAFCSACPCCSCLSCRASEIGNRFLQFRGVLNRACARQRL